MAQVTVVAGQSLQTAINNAAPGDVVSVEAGATFRGPIELPNKSGSGEIVIQSSRAAELPAGRVNPSHSALMPKIVAPNAEQAIRTKPGAHHYKLDGIEVLPESASITLFDLVRLGDSRHAQQTLVSVPHHIKVDRCYIHGLPTSSFQRGISLNSSDTEVTRSHFSEIHGAGMDSQAVAGWNGPGPFKIIDNYLEAAGENIMFGGADSASPELMPANIEIRRNYIFKPLSWKVGHPTYAGKHWTVKNLLELKAAKNVVIDGNVIENNWTDGQTGIPVLFTVRNQECTASWSTIANITFTNNTVKNAEGALNFLGKDNEAEPAFGKCPAGSTSVRGTDAFIGNNLFQNINGPFLLLNGFNNVTLDRNTSLQSSNLMTLYGEQSNGFKMTNGLTIDREFGIFGDGGLIGVAALNRWTPGWAVSGNVIASPYGIPAGAPYPTGNSYPATLTLPADFRSPFPLKGADIDLLLAAQAGSVVTVPTPTPTPVPSPTPTPVPSPTPLPTPVSSREVWEEAWPSNKAQQDAVWKRLHEAGWQGCIPVSSSSGNRIRCWRMKP